MLHNLCSVEVTSLNSRILYDFLSVSVYNFSCLIHYFHNVFSLIIRWKYLLVFYFLFSPFFFSTSLFQFFLEFNISIGVSITILIFSKNLRIFNNILQLCIFFGFLIVNRNFYYISTNQQIFNLSAVIFITCISWSIFRFLKQLLTVPFIAFITLTVVLFVFFCFTKRQPIRKVFEKSLNI